MMTVAAVGLPCVAQGQDVAQGQGAEAMESSSLPQSTRSAPIDIRPYIEAAQVVNAEISPGNDVVTYSRLAAGVDALLKGQHSSASASLRYERRIGWNGNNGNDGDTLSGLVRASAAIIPRTLTIEAGGMASRQSFNGTGVTTAGGLVDRDLTRQIYSVFAGPALTTNIGPARIESAYRFGYTKVNQPNAVISDDGAALVNSFDDSISQQASARISTRPGDVLPVGLALSGQWSQEDISALDQRVRNNYLRADITAPLSPTFALLGGIGYEDVQVSSREVLLDDENNPVIDSKGRYVTDKSKPREIAYEADGLIWDVGVEWRPSRRTTLEAHYGRRYNSSTYYGSLSYAPSRRSRMNLSVYDTISGFGGAMSNGLSALSTDFTAVRNPISGDLGGCVAGEEGEGNDCLIGSLGPIRSLTYRMRGVSLTYTLDLGRTKAGLGAGFESRKYIAPAGPIYADYSGRVDHNYWVSVFASRQIDARSRLTGNIYANWYDSDLPLQANGMGWSTSLAYYRNLMNGLSGTAAIGLDGFTREELADYIVGSAMLGMRYSF
ncbi:preprotein translocase subunit YajC [Altererythrobacter indicus]|uniref:Preprotein translocase subunit YajC n=1 Tax=Altericroceibacterium indicum TaxID=374177 RepID=A0A845A712_9SPHN|nr:preprotein translocase subunit YajC [Altericroceibacterium indicum]MXP25337.1 preprotein translocase subunit YajC [Altericroceibacterium indicum]